MNKNEKNLWLAFCELEEQFSKFSGAARYQNMNDSKINLYIGCRLAERYLSSFEKVNNYIDEVSFDEKNIIRVIKDFVSYADAKLKRIENVRWIQFVYWIENYN
jgi:hypothetical protein